MEKETRSEKEKPGEEKEELEQGEMPLDNHKQLRNIARVMYTEEVSDPTDVHQRFNDLIGV